MGIQDRDYYRESTRGLGILGERMHACLGLSALFVLVFFIELGTREQGAFGQLDPGSFTETFELDTTKVFSGEVWRIFTAPFLHDIGHSNSPLSGLFPIAVTLILLNWLGRHVEDIYGWPEFLGFCLVTAFLGSMGMALGAVLTGHPFIHVGPSGMITAVILLYALHYPHRTITLFFFIPTPVWFFVVLYATLDVLGFVQGKMHPALIFSHLVCGGFALLYYQFSLRVSNWIPTFQRSPQRRRTAPARTPMFTERPEPEGSTGGDLPVPRTNAKQAPVLTEMRTEPIDDKMDEKLEAQMDAVLEKMNRFGRESLTEEEWAILRRASEVCQKRRRPLG